MLFMVPLFSDWGVKTEILSNLPKFTQIKYVIGL